MEHITKRKFAMATVAVMVVMITGILTAPAAFASMEKPTFHLFIEKECLTAPEECMPGSTVEYRLTLYATCDEFPDGDEALPDPVVTDVLPEGMEFLGAETVTFNSELYEEEGCFCVDTFQNGNELTFQGIERWDDEDYYDFMTNDHITITYKCKISEDAEPGIVLTNEAEYSSSADTEPARDDASITVVANADEPGTEDPDAADETTEVLCEAHNTVTAYSQDLADSFGKSYYAHSQQKLSGEDNSSADWDISNEGTTVEFEEKIESRGRDEIQKDINKVMSEIRKDQDT